MVAYSLQSCWFQTWCISVRWHPEGFLAIFRICACGSKGSGVSNVALFFSPCQARTGGRASAAEAQASSSSRRRQDFPDSQYHGEERHRSPPGGYAQRKIEEAPSEDSHYQEKIIWRSVQHGFKLRRDWGRNVKEICTSPWDQTTCQVSSTSNVHGCYSSIENLMWPSND